MTQTYDVQMAIAAQNDYCNRKKQPMFAPDDGRCWHCFGNIYVQTQHANTYSVERAGSTHITGCPYCQRSFCE